MIQISAVFLTISKSGIIGIFLFAGILIISKINNKRTIILSILFIFIVTILTSFFLYHPNNNPESRQRIYTKAIIAFTQKPILGWGWANFDYAFDKIDWPIHYNDDVYVDKVHSEILEVLVTGGILGIILYLGIISRTIFILLKNHSDWNKVLLFSLILFIYHSQTNVISISEQVIFWTIIGLTSMKKPGDILPGS